MLIRRHPRPRSLRVTLSLLVALLVTHGLAPRARGGSTGSTGGAGGREPITGMHELVEHARPFVEEATLRAHHGVPPRDRLAVVYLLQGDEHTALERSPRSMIYKSVTMMLHHVGRYTPLDIFIFMREAHAPRDPRQHGLSTLGANVAVMPVLPAHWHTRYRDAYVSDQNVHLSDYMVMGQWRLDVPFTFAALLGYQYVWQLDDDSWILSPYTTNLVTRLRSGKFLMAAERILQEIPLYFRGLPELARSFLATHSPHSRHLDPRHHGDPHTSPLLPLPTEERLLPATTLWLHCNPPNASGLYTTRDGLGGFDNSYVWGNCLIMDTELWMRPLVQDWVQLCLLSGGTYRFRWNEQSVLALVWMLFVEPHQLLFLHDLNYSHSKPGPSPDVWRALLNGSNLTNHGSQAARGISSAMFEARLVQGGLLKKLVDAVKELCKEVNWDINGTGIQMQSMDSSHVCLVAFMLRADGFEHFRCDRPLTLGINLENLAKILKCAGNSDIITLKADDTGDTLTLMFESEKQDRISDVDLKLMSIESEHLGIPEQDYSADCKMPASEYQRIVRDLSSIGDTVLISATKEGIKFSTTGDIGTANVTLRQTNSADKEEEHVTIDLKEPVALTFALRYLNNFAKATALSPAVQVSLTKDLPIQVNYTIADLGYMKFYLAPKIEDEDAAAE